MARSVHSTAVSLALFSIACAAAPSATQEAAPIEASATRPASVPASPRIAAGGVDGADTRMLAQPAVSDEHIAFNYAGDLWVSRLDGTEMRRLTTHPGSEGRARFSPDGSLLAFSGQYDGNTDVFVVPVTGGVPQRLTWHAGPDIVQGFMPDGQSVLFTSRRQVHTRRYLQLFTVPVEGGHPDRLPIPYAFKASVSPDGGHIAYVPNSEPFRQWKNYRGGTASRIWIYDVATHEVVQIPQPEGRCNDTDPMWIGETVHFRSDRNGEFNLFSFTDEGVAQLTSHDDFPIVNASAGPAGIAYEQAGWLHLFDPDSGQTQRLVIGVAADLIETRPRYAKGDRYIRSASISPAGKRAVFGYRGEIISLPAEKGDPRNLTKTTGVHEREPAWSPDGRWIAYFSDAGGEYGLHIAPQDGRGDVRTFELGGAGFYEDPAWSPDAKKISYVDNSWSLFVLDIESGDVKKIGQEPLYGPVRNLHHAWSPDSRWVAYTLNTENYFRRVHLYDVESDESHVVTDGFSDVGEPVFDASGKYLYFTASTDAGPVNMWFAMSSADMEQTNSLYLAVLSAETPSPFARESDEEEIAEEEEADDETDEADAADDDASAESAEEGEEAKEEEIRVAIDLDGLTGRIVALPLPRAYYSSLQPGKEGKLFYMKGERGGLGGAQENALASFDLEGREETVLEGCIQGFALSFDTEQVLIAAEDGWRIAGSGEKIEGGKGALAVKSLQVKIDPREEWPQILDEVWRINRDYFYDPNMHGADWPVMKEKYAVFLPDCVTRGDLNRVIRWMCSELAVGHHGGGGGDTLVDADDVPGGLLGADYEIADGRYRFAKVYGGLNWNPDLHAPLAEPGVDVKAGEYLLEVDGEELFAPENLFSRFENTVGKIVRITVGPSADGSDSRTVDVVPIGNESSLRNRAWIEGNIARVTEATAGRVAYVHVPDTADRGHTYFKRYFFPQADREAIIVDERHNSGGQIADYYIDILRRPYTASWAMRYGADLRTPQGAIHGPKVMIIDETAGSGGDLLPWMFREREMGPLIGRATWGGLVGILGFPALMDGGRITAPNLGFFTEKDGFAVENVGVPPDIEVEQLPKEIIAGRDPQLEKAIEVVLEMLEENPPPKHTRPSFPIRVRK